MEVFCIHDTAGPEGSRRSYQLKQPVLVFFPPTQGTQWPYATLPMEDYDVDDE